jgi:DNA-binding response OmpR family regulator
MRILIADDDLTTRTTLKAVLQKCGHEVVEARDGTEAWAELQRPDAPRVAVLDWLMPGLDGREICRRVRAGDQDHAAYLILLTVCGGKKDVCAGLHAGADDYISKPFDPVELAARVEVGRRVIGLQEGLAAKLRELREALDHIKTLHGILPICANCKKIRDDKGYWSQVEAYVSAHSEAVFSHGICPECMGKCYPEYAGEAGEVSKGAEGT